ncbi:cupin domain-containing protein [Tenacibaculum agarivorans]|uniref:cupin domain-containing protein n=1 Tax=Tenacibaculum agarivorans TaxID=1908389 RepID=UPI00094B7F83|nr:cupin domain-containing protein [Tenacibaculum agarivorans]
MKRVFVPFFILFLMIISCHTNKITQTQVTTLTKTTKSWNGTKLPNYPEGDPEITILKIVIPPKTKLALHKHPEINAGVLLKGELTVISEAKDTLHLKAGDPIVELVNTYHFGENNSKNSAEIIVFYAGEKGKPITILKEEKDHH